MKLIRFEEKNNPEKICYGKLEGEKFHQITSSPYADKIELIDKPRDLKEVRILPPVSPRNIICIATNFSGATGVSNEMLEPVIFLKGCNTITSNGSSIHLPVNLKCWGESELGFVIKKTIKSQKKEEPNVSDSILGFLPCNDVSCDNISNRDHHLARSKSADNFCPVGEYIDTTYDHKNKFIRAYHNDQLLRDGNTSEFIWSPSKIIFELSKWMTLNPGDLILTGAPKRVRDRQFLEHGDEYRIEIEGLPILSNRFTK